MATEKTPAKTNSELLRESYVTAEKRLREKFPDEFNQLRIEAAKELGIEWKPRPTPEQIAAAKLAEIKAEFPHLLDSVA